MTSTALLRKAEEHECQAAELRRCAAEMAAQERETAIAAHKIDALVIDPFVSSHRATENDNGAIGRRGNTGWQNGEHVQ